MKKLMVVTCVVLCGLASVPAADTVMNSESFPSEQYWILALSKTQLEEVELRRRVTLSKEQLNDLRAVAPSFPKRLGVASPFVDQIQDSRFSLWPEQVSGIWFCKDKVAISRKALDGAEGCREFNTTLNASDAVLVNTSGAYSIGPRAVDDKKLIKILDKLAFRKPPGADFDIFILRPPMLRDRSEELVVQRAVEELAELCEARGLDCYIGG